MPKLLSDFSLKMTKNSFFYWSQLSSVVFENANIIASEADGDVMIAYSFLFPTIKPICLVCIEIIRIVGDLLPFVSSNMEETAFRSAMWNPGCCDRSTRTSNFYFWNRIMSQFKVEKGLDVQSIFSSHSLTSTDCRSKETVCYGFILSEFSSLLLCVISPFFSHKSERVIRSLWES